VINEVEVGFRDMTPGQATMANLVIGKARKDARKVGEAKASIDLLTNILNLVESMIIDDVDREHVLDSMLTGKMELADIYRILRRGQDEPPDDDEDLAQPKKKTTASRTRVQR
jgi:hypothetical protein